MTRPFGPCLVRLLKGPHRYLLDRLGQGPPARGIVRFDRHFFASVLVVPSSAERMSSTWPIQSKFTVKRWGRTRWDVVIYRSEPAPASRNSMGESFGKTLALQGSQFTKTDEMERLVSPIDLTIRLWCSRVFVDEVAVHPFEDEFPHLR
jgi:hypothetical protein